jgi:hypothetical protein
MPSSRPTSTELYGWRGAGHRALAVPRKSRIPLLTSAYAVLQLLYSTKSLSQVHVSCQPITNVLCQMLNLACRQIVDRSLHVVSRLMLRCHRHLNACQFFLWLKKSLSRCFRHPGNVALGDTSGKSHKRPVHFGSRHKLRFLRLTEESSCNLTPRCKLT